MERMIYVNLPVKDLARTTEFWTSMGFTFDEMFTNENATAMNVTETIKIMFLVEQFYKDFTQKEIIDPFTQNEVLLCLSAESREEIDETVNKAVAAGGKEGPSKQDMGFMYGWGFQDIDGHSWELSYMDMEAAMQANAEGEIPQG